MVGPEVLNHEHAHSFDRCVLDKSTTLALAKTIASLQRKNQDGGSAEGLLFRFQSFFTAK